MLLKLTQYQWVRRFMGGDWYRIGMWGMRMYGNGIWVQIGVAA